MHWRKRKKENEQRNKANEKSLDLSMGCKRDSAQSSYTEQIYLLISAYTHSYVFDIVVHIQRICKMYQLVYIRVPMLLM